MRFKEFLYRPFMRAGQWLAQRLLRCERAKWQKLRRELAFVSEYGEGSKESRTLEGYLADKIAGVLLICFWGTGLCIAVELSYHTAVEFQAAVERPACGQGETEKVLMVEIEGERETEKITLRIPERRFTEKELTELFSEVEKSMEKTILGENASLREVRSPLDFPTAFAEGRVTAEWFTDPSGILDETGNLAGEAEETGSPVEIHVILRCQEKEEEYTLRAIVFPPPKTEREAFAERIKDAARQMEEDAPYSQTVPLPDELEGKALRWKNERESVTGIIIIFVLTAAFCFFQKEDEKIRRKAAEKRFRLQMDYPVFLYKLTALLQAGLTIRAAFLKIGENSEARCVYREVLRCCNEIQSGVPEAQAYENFGRRCQLAEYIKISSILSQNLKKGSDGLAGLLEEEAVRGLEERRNLAKKLGEQAGTKLLFPMLLMLIIVMVILMVPAVLSFSAG